MKTYQLQFKGRELCDEVYTGRKLYEIRKNDEDYTTGDLIQPIAIDDDLNKIDHPINNCFYRITFVLDKHTGIQEGYCVLGLDLAEDRNVNTLVFTDITDDILFHLVQWMCVLAIVFVTIWSIISWIPTMSIHEHTEECFDVSGTAICGKADGEIYWTDSIIPSPVEVLLQYRENHEE